MNSPYPLRFCVCALLLGGSAWAEVQVQLPKESLVQYQPFRVSFEARGSGLDFPDLTPLSQDFDILDRNVNRSSRNFNGQMSQQILLNLTLRPKRGGELEIPAIRFGAERSRPQPIQVAQGGTPGGSSHGGPVPEAGGASPFTPAPQGYPPSYGDTSGPGPGPRAGGELPGMSGWSGGPSLPGWGGYGMPPWSGVPGGPDWGTWPAGPPTGPAATPVPTVTPAAGQWPYWPWVAGVAGLGWLLTGLALWRVSGGPPLLIRLPRRRPRPAPTPAPETPPAPRESPEPALAAVREAYRNNDPFAAREALLRWAGRVWPQDPPSNLSRLAARCPPPVQRHLLKLDEALYSPKPVPWNEDAVVEQLAALSRAAPTDRAPS